MNYSYPIYSKKKFRLNSISNYTFFSSIFYFGFSRTLHSNFVSSGCPVVSTSCPFMKTSCPSVPFSGPCAVPSCFFCGGWSTCFLSFCVPSCPLVPNCHFVFPTVLFCPPTVHCVPQLSSPGNCSKLNFPATKGFDNIHQSSPDYIAKFPNMVAPMRAFFQIIKRSNMPISETQNTTLYSVQLILSIWILCVAVLMPMMMNVPLKVVCGCAKLPIPFVIMKASSPLARVIIRVSNIC